MALVPNSPIMEWPLSHSHRRMWRQAPESTNHFYSYVLIISVLIQFHGFYRWQAESKINFPNLEIWEICPDFDSLQGIIKFKINNGWDRWPTCIEQGDKCVVSTSDRANYNTLYKCCPVFPWPQSASEKIYEKFLKIDESRPRHKQ